MTARLLANARTAPQSAQEGPEPPGTRNGTRSPIHGARRGVPDPCADTSIARTADTPRQPPRAPYSPQDALLVPEHPETAARPPEALTAPIETETPMTDPTATRRHIHLVIDRSGSMASKEADTEGGIAALLTTVSLVELS
jgi:hypothetical protein